jgi:hypothetical protein
MESNVAINGGGLLPDAVIVGGELLLDAGVVLPDMEPPPHAPSTKTEAALAHCRRRIAGYLANMRTQLRVAGL